MILTSKHFSKKRQNKNKPLDWKNKKYPRFQKNVKKSKQNKSEKQPAPARVMVLFKPTNTQGTSNIKQEISHNTDIDHRHSQDAQTHPSHAGAS